MPDLLHSLQGRDLGHLRIVASLWGIELKAPDAHTALLALVKSLLDPGLVTEVCEALPGEAQQAIRALIENEGRILWSIFSRRFGTIRAMGPGRRDRELPHMAPTSPAEILWYRGLIGRAFLKTATEPQEFAYIPDEFLHWLPSFKPEHDGPAGQPASPGECIAIRPANDHILDLTCTLLAALRLAPPGSQPALPPGLEWEIPPLTLQALLAAAGLIDANGVTQPELTRAFLEANRGDALLTLAKAWRNSTTFNELRLVPGLVCEGEWRNDPFAVRQALLDLLSLVPAQGWWSLPAFVSEIHQRHPDFQRTAGEYDAWFIRSLSSGEYLRGVEYWDAVEGALINYLIEGPLHWLGILDLAAPEPGAPAMAFRFSTWAAALSADAPPVGLLKEDAPIQISSDGRLHLPALTPRAVRYLVARFCQWETASGPDEYRYRITPNSLERARSQGLRPAHLISLLRRYAANPPTPALVQSIEHWDEHGAQAVFEKVTILRVSSPEILSALRRSPAARFLGDPLSATSAIVNENATEKVIAALAQMGYLADARFD